MSDALFRRPLRSREPQGLARFFLFKLVEPTAIVGIESFAGAGVDGSLSGTCGKTSNRDVTRSPGVRIAKQERNGGKGRR